MWIIYKINFGLNVIVALNKYNTDTDQEIQAFKEVLEKEKITYSIADVWANGGKGAIELAQKVIDASKSKRKIQYTYNMDDSLEEKIEKICKEIYGASDVEYLDGCLEKISKIEKMGYKKFNICMAKTQYSFSDDPTNLECADKFKIRVKDVIVKAGAEFVVIFTGNIFTMPGLPKHPAAENIDIDSNGNIKGIF